MIEKLTGESTFLIWRETVNDIIDSLYGYDQTKIPVNHASEDTTYGIGNNDLYGHVKVTDNINSEETSSDGVAASIYALKQVNTSLTKLSSNVATSLDEKADKVHNHKNIISGGRIAFVPSGLDASDTATQIPLQGCSVGEVYGDDASPVSYGNVINVRGDTTPGGGQLLMEWKSKDSTTGDLYYRSHRDTNSGGWGDWRKLLYSDNPSITGTASAENISAKNISSTNISVTTMNVSGDSVLKNLTTTSNVQFNSGFTATGACNVTGNVSVNGDITGNRIYNAVWNDYAEYFERGEDTEVGDIIAIHPTRSNIYVKSYSRDCVVVGVHSDTYGMILGGESEKTEEYIPVGLKGRVMVKVYGECKIGDTIVPSDKPGIGVVDNNEFRNKYIVGYVVEDKEGGDKIRLVRILLR